MTPIEKEYKFKKLQKAKKFKQWNRNITFAFQEAILLEHILGIAIQPLKLKSHLDNDKDQQKWISQ